MNKEEVLLSGEEYRQMIDEVRHNWDRARRRNRRLGNRERDPSPGVLICSSPTPVSSSRRLARDQFRQTSLQTLIYRAHSREVTGGGSDATRRVDSWPIIADTSEEERQACTSLRQITGRAGFLSASLAVILRNRRRAS